jgi:hypothetical protein
MEEDVSRIETHVQEWAYMGDPYLGSTALGFSANTASHKWSFI